MKYKKQLEIESTQLRSSYNLTINKHAFASRHIYQLVYNLGDTLIYIPILYNSFHKG